MYTYISVTFSKKKSLEEMLKRFFKTYRQSHWNCWYFYLF